MAKLGSLCFYLGIMALAAGVSQLAAKRNKKWLLLIPIAVLSLVAGLRASTVGTDTQNVLATMEYCYRHHFWDHSKEWLFYFLCEYLMKFWYNTSFVLTVFAVLNYVLIFARLWDFRETIHMGTSVALFLLFYFGTSMNIVRQSMALAMVFYATRFLERKKYLRFFICVAIASLIHVSAFFAAVIPILYIFAEKQFTVRKLFAVLMYLFSFIVASVYLLRFYGGYLHGEGVDIGLMTPVCMTILFVTYLPHLVTQYRLRGFVEEETGQQSRQEASIHLLFLLSFLGYLIECVGFVFTWAGRAGMYMRFFEIVYYGAVFKSGMYDRLFKIALFLALLLLGGYSLWMYSRVIPYAMKF